MSWVLHTYWECLLHWCKTPFSHFAHFVYCYFSIYFFLFLCFIFVFFYCLAIIILISDFLCASDKNTILFNAFTCALICFSPDSFIINLIDIIKFNVFISQYVLGTRFLVLGSWYFFDLDSLAFNNFFCVSLAFSLFFLFVLCSLSGWYQWPPYHCIDVCFHSLVRQCAFNIRHIYKERSWELLLLHCHFRSAFITISFLFDLVWCALLICPLRPTEAQPDMNTRFSGQSNYVLLLLLLSSMWDRDGRFC